MRILRFYLLKELLQPTGMAMVLFTFILLVGNLVKLADLLVNKGVPILAILQMFSLLVPALLSHTVPMAVLTGTLLAFGRLSSDREILAMRTSGVSLLSIAAPILVVAFTLSLGLIPINDQVVPWSHYAGRRLLADIGIRNPTAFLEGGTFIKEFKPYILFIYRVEGNRLTKIRIYEPREGRPTRTIVAERGEFIPVPKERRVMLKLYDGSSDEPDPKDPAKFYKLEFKSYAMNLALKEGQDSSKIERKPKDMNMDQLRVEAAKLQMQGIDATPLKVEAHRRVALAFSPFAFVLVGLPLGITTRRAQKSIGLGLSVLIFLGYYVLLVLGQSLAERGWIPIGPGLWMGNLVLLLAGSVLLWRSSRQ
ncbi:MAG: LptF/LptG family permease [Candidatus Omnitrophica bacterium]|nr:LptF/LptG family permease [Candidatus Omnitrophota bacterium]